MSGVIHKVKRPKCPAVILSSISAFMPLVQSKCLVGTNCIMWFKGHIFWKKKTFYQCFPIILCVSSQSTNSPEMRKAYFFFFSCFAFQKVWAKTQRALTPLPPPPDRFSFCPLRPPHTLLVFVLIQTCGSCSTGMKKKKRSEHGFTIIFQVQKHVTHLWVPIHGLIVSASTLHANPF